MGRRRWLRVCLVGGGSDGEDCAGDGVAMVWVVGWVEIIHFKVEEDKHGYL